YDYTLRTGADVVPASTNHLLVSFEKPGTVWLQLLSLFPPTYHDRANGNRADIMQMLADMLAATGDQSQDRDQDAVGVGDDNLDYSANQDDSVTSDDVGQDFGGDDASDLGSDDGGGFDDGGGDFGGGDDFSS
ncbi:MAG TPA: hypothetical protein VJU82_08905, partial [Acidobacteriaceae bacterium]|nr:hypothetical protein [Acidobacteriaceae bacterium]